MFFWVYSTHQLELPMVRYNFKRLFLAYLFVFEGFGFVSCSKIVSFYL